MIYLVLTGMKYEMHDLLIPFVLASFEDMGEKWLSQGLHVLMGFQDRGPLSSEPIARNTQTAKGNQRVLLLV